MIEENRKQKIAVVFHYSPTNAFHMINVSRDESLHRLRAFWEILGNLSAEDHRFLLSESVSVPQTGIINDILPETAFVIGILVEPLEPAKYDSNTTLATNFADSLGFQDIWETIETDRKPINNRVSYRLTLSNSEDTQRLSYGPRSPLSREASTIPPSVADNLSPDFTLAEGELKDKEPASMPYAALYNAHSGEKWPICSSPTRERFQFEFLEAASQRILDDTVFQLLDMYLLLIGYELVSMTDNLTRDFTATGIQFKGKKHDRVLIKETYEPGIPPQFFEVPWDEKLTHTGQKGPPTEEADDFVEVVCQLVMDETIYRMLDIYSSMMHVLPDNVTRSSELKDAILGPSDYERRYEPASQMPTWDDSSDADVFLCSTGSLLSSLTTPSRMQTLESIEAEDARLLARLASNASLSPAPSQTNTFEDANQEALEKPSVVVCEVDNSFEELPNLVCQLQPHMGTLPENSLSTTCSSLEQTHKDLQCMRQLMNLNIVDDARTDKEKLLKLFQRRARTMSPLERSSVSLSPNSLQKRRNAVYYHRERRKSLMRAESTGSRTFAKKSKEVPLDSESSEEKMTPVSEKLFIITDKKLPQSQPREKINISVICEPLSASKLKKLARIQRRRPTPFPFQLNIASVSSSDDETPLTDQKIEQPKATSLPSTDQALLHGSVKPLKAKRPPLQHTKSKEATKFDRKIPSPQQRVHPVVPRPVPKQQTPARDAVKVATPRGSVKPLKAKKPSPQHMKNIETRKYDTKFPSPQQRVHPVVPRPVPKQQTPARDAVKVATSIPPKLQPLPKNLKRATPGERQALANYLDNKKNEKRIPPKNAPLLQAPLKLGKQEPVKNLSSPDHIVVAEVGESTEDTRRSKQSTPAPWKLSVSSSPTAIVEDTKYTEHKTTVVDESENVTKKTIYMTSTTVSTQSTKQLDEPICRTCGTPDSLKRSLQDESGYPSAQRVPTLDQQPPFLSSTLGKPMSYTFVDYSDGVSELQQALHSDKDKPVATDFSLVTVVEDSKKSVKDASTQCDALEYFKPIERRSPQSVASATECASLQQGTITDTFSIQSVSHDQDKLPAERTEPPQYATNLSQDVHISRIQGLTSYATICENRTLSMEHPQKEMPKEEKLVDSDIKQRSVEKEQKAPDSRPSTESDKTLSCKVQDVEEVPITEDKATLCDTLKELSVEELRTIHLKENRPQMTGPSALVCAYEKATLTDQDLSSYVTMCENRTLSIEHPQKEMPKEEELISEKDRFAFLHADSDIKYPSVEKEQKAPDSKPTTKSDKTLLCKVQDVEEMPMTEDKATLCDTLKELSVEELRTIHLKENHPQMTGPSALVCAFEKATLTDQNLSSYVAMCENRTLSIEHPQIEMPMEEKLIISEKDRFAFLESDIKPRSVEKQQKTPDSKPSTESDKALLCKVKGFEEVNEGLHKELEESQVHKMVQHDTIALIPDEELMMVCHRHRTDLDEPSYEIASNEKASLTTYFGLTDYVSMAKYEERVSPFSSQIDSSQTDSLQPQDKSVQCDLRSEDMVSISSKELLPWDFKRPSLLCNSREKATSTCGLLDGSFNSISNDSVRSSPKGCLSKMPFFAKCRKWKENRVAAQQRKKDGKSPCPLFCSKDNATMTRSQDTSSELDNLSSDQRDNSLEKDRQDVPPPIPNNKSTIAPHDSRPTDRIINSSDKSSLVRKPTLNNNRLSSSENPQDKLQEAGEFSEKKKTLSTSGNKDLSNFPPKSGEPPNKSGEAPKTATMPVDEGSSRFHKKAVTELPPPNSKLPILGTCSHSPPKRPWNYYNHDRVLQRPDPVSVLVQRRAQSERYRRIKEGSAQRSSLNPPYALYYEELHPEGTMEKKTNRGTSDAVVLRSSERKSADQRQQPPTSTEMPPIEQSKGAIVRVIPPPVPPNSPTISSRGKPAHSSHSLATQETARQVITPTSEIGTNTDISMSPDLPEDAMKAPHTVITQQVVIMNEESLSLYNDGEGIRRKCTTPPPMKSTDGALAEQSEWNSESLDEAPSTCMVSRGTNTEPDPYYREEVAAPAVVEKVGCLTRMKWPIGYTRKPSTPAQNDRSLLDASSLCPWDADESSHTSNCAKFVVICKWSQETFALRIPLAQSRLPVLALREAVESRIRELCRLEQLRGVRRSDLAPVVDVDFGFFFAGEDGARAKRSEVKDVVLHCLRDQDKPLLIPAHWSSMIFVYKL